MLHLPELLAVGSGIPTLPPLPPPVANAIGTAFVILVILLIDAVVFLGTLSYGWIVLLLFERRWHLMWLLPLTSTVLAWAGLLWLWAALTSPSLPPAHVDAASPPAPPPSTWVKVAADVAFWFSIVLSAWLAAVTLLLLRGFFVTARATARAARRQNTPEVARP